LEEFTSRSYSLDYVKHLPGSHRRSNLPGPFRYLKRNLNDSFDVDGDALLRARPEMPSRKSEHGYRVEPCIGGIEYTNAIDVAVGANDRVKDDGAFHTIAHQFRRISRINFFRRNRRAEVNLVSGGIEFSITDYPTSDGRGKVRHVQHHGVELLAAEDLVIDTCAFGWRIAHCGRRWNGGTCASHGIKELRSNVGIGRGHRRLRRGTDVYTLERSVN